MVCISSFAFFANWISSQNLFVGYWQLWTYTITVPSTRENNKVHILSNSSKNLCCDSLALFTWIGLSSPWREDEKYRLNYSKLCAILLVSGEGSVLKSIDIVWLGLQKRILECNWSGKYFKSFLDWIKLFSLLILILSITEWCVNPSMFSLKSQM